MVLQIAFGWAYAHCHKFVVYEGPSDEEVGLYTASVRDHSTDAASVL